MALFCIFSYCLLIACSSSISFGLILIFKFTFALCCYSCFFVSRNVSLYRLSFLEGGGELSLTHRSYL